MSFDAAFRPGESLMAVPLFPLPNLVLFPQVLQPLHLFEPRYREMTADALAADRQIALALLRPGWEADYDGRPAIYETVCLGRIIADERLPDGRYNVIVQGLQRAKVVREQAGEKPYRIGLLELIEETPADTDDSRLCQALTDQLREILPKLGATLPLQTILGGDLPLGVVCDMLASSLRFDPAEAILLLSEPNVRRRAEKLLVMIQLTPEPAGRTYPLPFHLN